MGYRHNSVIQKEWFSKKDLEAFYNYYIDKENFSDDDQYQIEAYNEKVVWSQKLKELRDHLTSLKKADVEEPSADLLNVFKFHHNFLLKEIFELLK